MSKYDFEPYIHNPNDYTGSRDIVKEYGRPTDGKELDNYRSMICNAHKRCGSCPIAALRNLPEFSCCADVIFMPEFMLIVRKYFRKKLIKSPYKKFIKVEGTKVIYEEI